MDPWAPNDLIRMNSYREYDGTKYKCVVQHVSTEEFDKSKFRKVKEKTNKNMNGNRQKYAVITSMNQDYYDHCGRDMLRSFRATWGKNLQLYVYNEDGFRVKVKDAIPMGWNLGEEYEAFQKRHGNRKIRVFSKKAFSVIHALEHLDVDRLIWLDADTICTEIIPTQLLEMLSPDDVLSSHFGVKHLHEGKWYFSCETGFFVVNRRHPQFQKFLDTYKHIYTQDDYTNLRRFYDGEVYGETVRRLQSQGAKMLELNPGEHKTPISRSIIAPYVSHLKAGLKDRLSNEEIIGLHHMRAKWDHDEAQPEEETEV
jgi:hypothetical protein